MAGGYALNVCETCRKRKRKCNKRLPQCSFCASLKNSTCKYAVVDGPSFTETSLDSGQQDSLRPRSQFPSVYFLDHEVYHQSNLEIPNPSIPLSHQILKRLGENSHIRNVASRYFDNMQSFMPIISKKLFYERHLHPLATPRTDVLLLCQCMKLFTWTPLEKDSDPQTQDYILAKRYVVETEVAGIFTLQALQANLLVAIYELGHGIYPSAYTSIGVCATRGIALGLEKELTDYTSSQYTWIEAEERRRVWWAIVILERVINLGWPGRSFVTNDPISENLLPADDSAWDEGIVTQNHPINLLTTGDADMGRYGRLALATHLLCRAFQHKAESFSDPSMQAEELAQLDRTLHAAIVLCDLEGKRRGFTCCSPVDICHRLLNYSPIHHYGTNNLTMNSALLMLHTTSTITKQGLYCEESKAHDLAIARMVANSIVTRSEIFLNSGPGALQEVSPLGMHSPYKAATVCIRLNRKSPGEESLRALSTLNTALKVKNRKWRIAGSYLQILDAREVMQTL